MWPRHITLVIANDWVTGGSSLSISGRLGLMYSLNPGKRTSCEPGPLVIGVLEKSIGAQAIPPLSSYLQPIA